MHSNRSSTLGSTRALSLSTEHMNKEPSLIDIPPPMSNLPYDPPHLSRWQQAPQRLQNSSNSRSGSAVASRFDNCYQQHQQTKCATLNDQFRALTLHSRNHCDPHRASTIRPGILNANTYELSDDLRAKEVDLMERYYGGRLRAQRAARIIQRKYREYRMRAQYAQLRTDRRLTNRLANGLNSYYPDDNREAQHLASMEDLVIDRAYLDWESEVAGSPGGGSIPDLTVEAKGNRSSAPSASTQSPESAEEVSSHSCTNLTAPKTNQNSSPGTGTGSTSGFVSSPGSCSSGSLQTAEVSPQVNTAPQVVRQASDLQNQHQQPVLYYVMDNRADEQQPQPAPRVQQTQQLYVAVPVRSDHNHQQYVNVAPQQSQPRYVTQQSSTTKAAPTTAVLVRRSSTGSSAVQTTPVWCTPDGKMYTLAYAEPSTGATLVVSPTTRQTQQPIVVAPKNSPVLLQLRQHSSGGVASATNLVSVGSRNTAANAAMADRCRKRLYRVCLNYFNK